MKGDSKALRILREALASAKEQGCPDGVDPSIFAAEITAIEEEIVRVEAAVLMRKKVKDE